MKIAAIAFATVCLAAAGAAAASQRVTDVDYLRAARCKGLASGLGSVDTSRLDAFLKDQGRTRDASIYERSDAEMRKGRREAGDAEAKGRLNAELNGPCLAYLNGGTVMGASR